MKKIEKDKPTPPPPPPADTITNINLILKSVLTRKETSQHVPTSLPARVGENASTSGDLKGCFSPSFSISLR